MALRLPIPYPDRTLAVVFPFSKGHRISRREFSDYSGNGTMVLAFEPTYRKAPLAVSFRLEGWHFGVDEEFLCQQVQAAFEREVADELQHTARVVAVTIVR